MSEHDGATKWELGKWVHVDGEIELCKNGLRASKEPLDSLNNIYGDRWFVAEAKGEIIEGNGKFCASDMRLVAEIPMQVIKQFTVDCAKHVLPIWEKKYPSDDRPKKAIEAAENYLIRKISLKELTKAGDAAWAAWAAAWAAGDAARAAERKWQNNHLKQLISGEVEKT